MAVRTLLGTFTTWITANFLTGNPANITAAKVRELGERVGANTRTSIAFHRSTVPQAVVAIDDTTPQLVVLDSGNATNIAEITVDDVLSKITVLIDLFFGTWVYDVRAVAIVEGALGDILVLGIYQNTTLVASGQVELQGVGVPVTVFAPAKMLQLSANDELTLKVTALTGAVPFNATINAAALDVCNLPGQL